MHTKINYLILNL